MAKTKVTKQTTSNKSVKGGKSNNNVKAAKSNTSTLNDRSKTSNPSQKSGQTPINRFTVPVSELKKRKAETTLQDSFSAVKKRKFTGKQTKNWKPLNQTTQDYVNQSLDTGVGFIISKATNEGHQIDEIQTILCKTVQLVKNNLKVLKAPTKTYGDFKKISQIQKTAGQQLIMVRQQEDTLEDVVREEESLVKGLEKELRRLKSSSDDDLQLHPFLQNFEPELHIPSIH